MQAEAITASGNDDDDCGDDDDGNDDGYKVCASLTSDESMWHGIFHSTRGSTAMNANIEASKRR